MAFFSSLLIVAHRFDATVVSLIHFILFGEAYNCFAPTMCISVPFAEAFATASAVPVGIAAHQPIEKRQSRAVRLILKPAEDFKHTLLKWYGLVRYVRGLLALHSRVGHTSTSHRLVSDPEQASFF